MPNENKIKCLFGYHDYDKTQGFGVRFEDDSVVACSYPEPIGSFAVACICKNCRKSLYVTNGTFFGTNTFEILENEGCRIIVQLFDQKLVLIKI